MIERAGACAELVVGDSESVECHSTVLRQHGTRPGLSFQRVLPYQGLVGVGGNCRTAKLTRLAQRRARAEERRRRSEAEAIARASQTTVNPEAETPVSENGEYVKS